MMGVALKKPIFCEVAVPILVPVVVPNAMFAASPTVKSPLLWAQTHVALEPPPMVTEPPELLPRTTVGVLAPVPMLMAAAEPLKVTAALPVRAPETVNAPAVVRALAPERVRVVSMAEAPPAPQPRVTPSAAMRKLGLAS